MEPFPTGHRNASVATHPGTVHRRVSRMLLLAVFAGVLGIDLATKAWAASVLTDPFRVADWLYLMIHRNSGMFLGTVPLSDGYWIVVCAAAGWFGMRALRSRSAPIAVCLVAALAGMTGNAIGQAQGAVVDFIGIGPVTGDVWLVVNVADLALVGGAFVLGIYLIRERVRRANRPSPRRCARPLRRQRRRVAPRRTFNGAARRRAPWLKR